MARRSWFDGLVEEWKILVNGHEIQGTADFALFDEHFEVAHDLSFSYWCTGVAEQEQVRSKQMVNE